MDGGCCCFKLTMSLWDRLRMFFGVPLYVTVVVDDDRYSVDMLAHVGDKIEPALFVVGEEVQVDD